MRYGAGSAAGGSAGGLRPVDQPGLLVLADEQVAGIDAAARQRVPVRRHEPAGFQPGPAGAMAAGPGIQAGRRISGQFATAVDQPGQFAGGRRGGDRARGPDAASPRGHGHDTAGIG